MHFSVRDKKGCVYNLRITLEGRKDVLTIEIGDNESSKFWLSVFNNLKNRGIKDIFILCADGLTGMKEVVTVALSKTKYQRCHSISS